ncbi:MAG: hypothetical protein M1830_004855 [Pleopsidium flavum]|nr:MAG: hypothetical protein M1830_004855 [Pleopsidium flavum]
MDIELLPSSPLQSTVYNIVPNDGDLEKRESGSTSIFSLKAGAYSIIHRQNVLTPLSKSFPESQVDSQPDFVPSYEAASYKTQQDQGDSGHLFPKSFLRPSRSRRIWNHILVATAALVLLSVPLAFSRWGADYLIPGFEQTTACDYQGQAPDPQGVEALFRLDLVFGRLSFAVAKFVDVLWDVFIGRGGQAILGWISYRVSTDCLMRIMETTPIPYDLYINFTFSWTTLTSLGPLLNFIFTKSKPRHKILMMWLVCSILWAGIYPTIMGAMTGYVANNDTLVRLKNEQYLNYTDFKASERAFLCQSYNCDPYDGITLYRDGPNETLWRELNQIPPQDYDPRYVVYVPDSSQPSASFEILHHIGNYTCDFDWELDIDNVQCIANSTYQWGFSSNFIYLAVACNALWTFCTYCIWAYANWKSELCRKGRRLGKYRAAMDMAEAVTQELGPDICAYKDKELEKTLKSRPPLRYIVSPLSIESLGGDRPAHIGLSSGKEGGALKLRFGQIYGRSLKGHDS